MLPYQRETADVVIKTDILAPVLVVMTPVACITLLALMHIVFSMAIYALALQLYLVGVFPVASCTIKLAMCSMQRKVGILVVIKFCTRPFLGVVTFVARGTVPALVDIIIQVTTAALAAYLFLDVPFVATVARSEFMLAPQREISLPVMVKPHLVPLLRHMTTVTILAIGACVFVINCMTRIARIRRILVLLAGMTTVTCHLFMRTFQGEIRFVMVKPLF